MRARRWLVAFYWEAGAIRYGPLPVWAVSEDAAAAEGLALLARECRPRWSVPESVTVEAQ